MTPWNAREAERRKWKKKIESVAVDARDTALKGLLVGQLSANDPQIALANFNTERAKLLSPRHGQKNHWTPHPGGLWRILRFLGFFGFFSSISAQGSALRLALLTTDESVNHQPIQETVMISPENDLEQNADFETAMYDQPQRAENHVRALITHLTTGTAPLDKILDRLYALRLELNAMDYFELLRKISETASPRVFLFLYQHYKANLRAEFLDEHTRIDIYWMAQFLITTQATCHVRDHTAQMQNLFILREADSLERTDYFAEFVTALQTNPAQDDMGRLLHHTLHDTRKEDGTTLYQRIAAKFPDSEKDPHLQIHRLERLEVESETMTSDDEPPYDPFALPSNLLRRFPPPTDPLTQMLVHLAKRQLLVHYLNPTEHDSADFFKKPTGVGYSFWAWLTQRTPENLDIPLIGEANKHTLSPTDRSTLLSPLLKPTWSSLLSLFPQPTQAIEADWLPLFLIEVQINTQNARKALSRLHPEQLQEIQKGWIITSLSPHCTPEQMQTINALLRGDPAGSSTLDAVPPAATGTDSLTQMHALCVSPPGDSKAQKTAKKRVKFKEKKAETAIQKTPSSGTTSRALQSSPQSLTSQPSDDEDGEGEGKCCSMS